jgi:hypothetical protein
MRADDGVEDGVEDDDDDNELEVASVDEDDGVEDEEDTKEEDGVEVLDVGSYRAISFALLHNTFKSGSGRILANILKRNYLRRDVRRDGETEDEV